MQIEVCFKRFQTLIYRISNKKYSNIQLINSHYDDDHQVFVLASEIL